MIEIQSSVYSLANLLPNGVLGKSRVQIVPKNVRRLGC